MITQSGEAGKLIDHTGVPVARFRATRLPCIVVTIASVTIPVDVVIDATTGTPSEGSLSVTCHTWCREDTSAVVRFVSDVSLF